jgi:eukaryotic-like serine/threonine-protein kinase
MPMNAVLERLRAATAGEFIIEREIGRGAMAVVYLAHEIALDRKVALKVLSPGLIADESMIERFWHEAKTIASLSHPHIISVYESREFEDLGFFVMTVVDGRSLEHLIRDVGPLPISVVRRVLVQVGSALAYAHRARVIHRDVKPDNILVDKDGRAVVTDFGLAQIAESPAQAQAGTMVGTPAYMSPEQCLGATISAASDQYSLGVVAYEMLTGRSPFTGPPLAVMQAHVEKPPPRISELRPDCPETLEAAVQRMLEKDPASRWTSMAEAVAASEATSPAKYAPHDRGGVKVLERMTFASR